jgi:hypothetical protein
MTLRPLLLASLLLAPLSASAAIDLDDPGDGGSGGGGTGGGTTTTPPTWQKTYAKGALFGTTSWGAGYAINGSLSAYVADATHKDRLAASMSAETYAKINGGRYRLFGARVAGNTEAKARTDLSFNAYVGSATIYSKSYASTTSTYTYTPIPTATWNTTFFDRSATVDLIVPITFRVKATGHLSANLTGKISNIGVEASANPSGKASLYASAAVGGQYCVGPACVGATAGVYSDVTLVQASAPANVALWWSLSKYGGVLLNYVAQASLSLSSLDGELGLFAEACLGGCVSDSVKLINWDGFTASYTIANMSGNYCLAGTCSLVFTPVVIGMAP